MKIIRNIDVSRTYGVSPTAVTNWIASSIQGRNNLQLTEASGKFQILDTTNNRNLMQILSKKGRAFKKKDYNKVVKPSKHFYKIFQEPALSSIILSLEKYREIPHKYTYINGGAEHWHDYVNRSFEEKIKNTVTNSSMMMRICSEFIFSKADKGTKFNIIDVGVGDASPVKNFLSKLHKKDLINKYIGIDVSPEILDIAEENVKNWFGADFPFEKHAKDISADSIQEILFYDSRIKGEGKIINLVLFIGSTIENQIDIERTLLNIKHNLSDKDYFFLGQTLDTQAAVTYFDIYSNKSPVKQKLPDQNKWIPDLLGISEDFYEVEMYFDDVTKTRKMDLVLNLDLTIEFENGDFQTNLQLIKGDRITVWRHAHHSFDEITKKLKDLNFFVDFYIVSDDKAQIITISQPVS